VHESVVYERVCVPAIDLLTTSTTSSELQDSICGPPFTTIAPLFIFFLQLRYRLLVLVWTIFSTVCAQAQVCSSKPAVFKVSSAQDAAALSKAALCDDAVISAVWQGEVQLARTIVVGNGTTLTVTGASGKLEAVIVGAK
jgi:hypothetical protein